MDVKFWKRTTEGEYELRSHKRQPYTRTAETLNYHPRTAVYQNAAISELVRASTGGKNFTAAIRTF